MFQHDKAEALKRLDAVHREMRREIRMAEWPLLTAQQIHGDKIAIVDQPVASDKEFAGCDGIITNQKRSHLVFMWPIAARFTLSIQKRRRSGSCIPGRRAATGDRFLKAIRQMRNISDQTPAELVVQLSPCIRPPHYEIDFAAQIIEQCRGAGVTTIHDTDRLHRVRPRSLLFLPRRKRKNRPHARAAWVDVDVSSCLAKALADPTFLKLGKLRFFMLIPIGSNGFWQDARRADIVS